MISTTKCNFEQPGKEAKDVLVSKASGQGSQSCHDLMQYDKTGRAREDLSRSFFRTLSELRKHQYWRYQHDAVDVSPPVKEVE